MARAETPTPASPDTGGDDSQTLQSSDEQTYIVDRKIAESDSVTSFYLVPGRGGNATEFLPGQYLTLLLDLPGIDRPVVRTYTISDRWRSEGYRISVKRQRSHNPDHLDGQASCFLHDHVQPGDCLRIRPPRGVFTLDQGSNRPVVLLSAGVGITPMISMLNAIVESSNGRRVWFIHGCRHSGEYAFSQHVKSCVASFPNIHGVVCFSRPREHDAKGEAYDFEGRVTLDLLRQVLPFDGYDFYLCGPSDFIECLYTGLHDLGVPRSRLHYEFFGPARNLRREFEPSQQLDLAVSSARRSVVRKDPSSRGTGPRVRFLRSKKEVCWDDSYDNLLDFAEASGLAPDFSCRSGICETCMCGLLDGKIEYVNEPLERPGEGKVLICSAKPISDITLDL